MANFISLMKVQLLSLFGTNKLLRSKTRKRALGFSGIALSLILITGVLVAFGYIYSEIFATSLSYMGTIRKLIPLMLAMACLVSFLYSFYSVGNSIFGFKDYDMLMSMPIKPAIIVASKFTFLYVTDLFFTLALVVPSLFVYNNFASGVLAIEIVSSLLMCFFAPLLPLGISTLIGLIFYYISSRFRKKNIIQIILLFLFMVAIFALSFLSSMLEEDPMAIMGTLGVVEKIYFIMPWAELAFFDAVWLLIFIATNLVPALIIIGFVCVFYKKLNTIFSLKRTLRNFKLKEYSSNGVNKTLFNKEIRRLFSSPVYALNSLMGVFMAVIITIGYVVFYFVLSAQVDKSTISEVFDVFNKILPAIFVFMFCLTPSTCACISMEGQAFWLIKTAPVSHLQVYNSKLLVHALFSTLVAFFCSIIITACTGFVFINGLLFVVYAIAISSFSGVFGLLMNLYFPKLKWKNENVPVKQSLPTFLCVLISMVLTGGMIALALLANLSTMVLFIIYASVFVVGTIVLYALLLKQGKRLFNRLS